MPADKGYSLPIAAFGVIALFISTTFFGPHAFDLLRFGENDASKRPQFLSVDARLWEDPFAALVRERARLKEICGPAVGESGGKTVDPRCLRGEMTPARFQMLHAPSSGEQLTVIAAMLPGASFVGAEEARRRVRYAILAGLRAEGFVPEDAEHLMPLRVRPCDEWGCASQADWLPDGAWPPVQKLMAALQRQLFPQLPPPRMDVLYERFVPRDTLNVSGSNSGAVRRRAVVLWFDDAALGPYWLRSLAVILGELAGRAPADRVRLRIIGPYKSDDLVKGLDDLTALSTPAGERRQRERQAMPLLSRVSLVSPFSTAPPEQLRAAAKAFVPAPCTIGPDGKCRETSCPPDIGAHKGIETDFRDRLRKLGVCLDKDASFFVPTIGTDEEQIDLLAKELCARGVAHPQGGRVVLLSEWDSIYARSFAVSLEEKLRNDTCFGGSWSKVTFESYPYLRGLDGANMDGGTRQVRLVPRGGDKSKDDRNESIEWPESRDQRDYVRRLVAHIRQGVKWESAPSVVRAIGMIGTDVHDKLLLAQVLREEFPDRVLFTTDLDARLVHPDTRRYTRNLVVASSLPLAVEDGKGQRTAPFRDAYQTAAYLAARYAVAATDKDGQALVDKQLKGKALYEIGRAEEVELRTGALSDVELFRRRAFAGVAATLLLGLLALTFVRPTPSMKHVLAGRDYEASTAFLAGLQIASWGFAAGVVLELAFPGFVGLGRALVLAALLALGFFIAFMMRSAFAGSTRGQGQWRLALWLLPVAAAVLIDRLWFTDLSDVHEPFSILSGISSWPAELIRTLAILLFVWFLDYAWTKGRNDAHEVGLKYFAALPETAGRVPVEGRWQRFSRLVGEFSIWLWKPEVRHVDRPVALSAVRYTSVDGSMLWGLYCDLLRDRPRFWRFAGWMAIAALLLFSLYLLMEGQRAEVPARGLDDRELFFWTGLAAAAATIALLVLVGDATVLTFRFVLLLRGGRTIYPDVTLEHFAKRLGDDEDLQRLSAARVAARTEDRGDKNVEPRNSLLDDWIDAHLLADHTAAIGPLILFPFILVALLVVSRSAVFDNWANGGPVLITLSGYVLWAIAMAALLNIGAEMARRKALEGMRRDLMWLEGSGDRYERLAKRFKAMIEEVENLRRGAFAPFFEQPLVQAILVPLGGAGGIQLLQQLVFAQP